MIIYIDFDGVIYDTVSEILKELEKNNLSLSDDCSSFFKNINWKNLLEKSSEINNSIDSIIKLSDKYNIKILTHVSSIFEMESKAEFIRLKIPTVDIIFVPKSIQKNYIVSAQNNILIDDSFKNVDNWKKSGGVGILFDKNTDDLAYIIENLKEENNG